MLRIHFTDRDRARVTMARAPDPLWETVLGVHQLTAPGPGVPVYAAWRRRAGTRLAEAGLLGPVRMLATLAPPQARYWPDFLTPVESADGLAAGLEALRATPRSRVRDELARAAGSRRLPGWCTRLATGERELLDELAEAFRLVHGAVVAPGWTGSATTTATDRALRARVLADGGLAALVDSFRPMMDWRPPVLHVRYPADLDLRLDGRTLRLVPSHFCWRTPVAYADPALPPVLVYPVEHQASRTAGVLSDARPRALAALLGRTRAHVLAALERPTTTGELARHLSVSPASASEHVRALRDTGLATSRRFGGRVLHTLTPLGTALLHGDPPPRSATDRSRPVSARTERPRGPEPACAR